MKIVDTYTANIYLGLKDGDNEYPSLACESVEGFCRRFVNKHGICVTVTPTHFVYGSPTPDEIKGDELGVVVGLINYPRFPTSPEIIREIATELAKSLKSKFCQKRVSIVCSDQTIMLEEHE